MLFRLNRGVPYAALAMGPQVYCAPHLGGGRMAKENSGQSLPRRVPGSADSPRPPARIKPPQLPESLIERLRAAAELAKEEEAAQAEEEAAQAEEEAAQAEREAAHPDGKPATRPMAIPLPRRPPAGSGEPGST